MIGYLAWLMVGVAMGVLGMYYIYRGTMISHGHENSVKESRKRRVLHLFEEKGRVTNNDVERAFHVSDATAERYLDELEKAGKVRQVGGHGKSVYYTKV